MKTLYFVGKVGFPAVILFSLGIVYFFGPLWAALLFTAVVLFFLGVIYVMLIPASLWPANVWRIWTPAHISKVIRDDFDAMDRFITKEDL